MITFLIIWLIGAIVAYYKTVSKFEEKTKKEKIVLSLLWPAYVILKVFKILKNKLDEYK